MGKKRILLSWALTLERNFTYNLKKKVQENKYDIKKYDSNMLLSLLNIINSTISQSRSVPLSEGNKALMSFTTSVIAMLL